MEVKTNEYLKIRGFISDSCYPEEPVRYYDEDLLNELVFFAEKWERLDGYPAYRKKADAFKTSAVLSLINGAFYDNMARDRNAKKLSRSTTKPDLVEIMTQVTSAYCWYIALKARIEIAEIKRKLYE